VAAQPQSRLLADPRLEAALAQRSLLRTAQASLRGCLHAWRGRVCSAQATAGVRADSQRARVSCYQQAGGAATRLIMSSLAGPGGLSEQEAAAVRCPHPCPRPTPACTRRARAVHRHARSSRRKPPSYARRSRTRSATGARASAPQRSGGWSSRPCGTARIEWLRRKRLH
jgi:hypothetical protein